MWDNATLLEVHTSGTPLYIPSSWYTPGKFWYTLGCKIHPVDKHCPRSTSWHCWCPSYGWKAPNLAGNP